jgi:hypothetical protein
MEKISEQFVSFLSDSCDRCSFIQSYLSERSVETAVLPVDGKRHVYVKFLPAQYNPQFRIKTVIAHYDRAPGSPGANDNSAAVFSLMDWAARLVHRSDFHNVRLLFTDGEELGAHGIAEQGAFSLASVFKRLGITNDDVYVFDCMGRGTIPVVGKTDDVASAPYLFRKRLIDLERRTEELLRTSSTGRWLKLPIPCSDNAGFIACGIPAVVLTLLPETDADLYLAALIKEKKLEGFITHKKMEPVGGENSELLYLRGLLPDTWKLFHTINDNAASLTAESYTVTAHILDVLAGEKTPV